MLFLTDVAGPLGRQLASHYQSHNHDLLIAGSALLEASLSSLEFCAIDCPPVETGARLRRFFETHRTAAIETAIVVPLGWTDMEESALENLVEKCLTRPMAIVRALLPSLIESQGKLVLLQQHIEASNTSATATSEGIRAGLGEFVRNLRVELSGTGVRVQTLYLNSLSPHEASNGTPTSNVDTAALVRAMDSRKLNIEFNRNGQSRFPSHDATSNAINPSQAKTAPSRSPKRCVITGAAGGIGRCLVQAYQAKGFAVTGIDVNQQAWHEVASLADPARIPPKFLATDLADPSALAQVLDQLHEDGPIDVFIHNAGLNEVGPFHQFDLARLEAITAINLTAPVLMTEALIEREMLTAPSCLVFMGSLSSAVGYAGAIPYAASKGALAAYAEARRPALSQRGTHVLTVHPGPTRTAMAEECSPINTARTRARRMAPEQVAEAIFRAVETRRKILYPGLKNQLSAALGRFFPRLTEYAMRKTVFDRLPASSTTDR